MRLAERHRPDEARVDFHSFRRAYNTALARAGVNAQTAMDMTLLPAHLRAVLLAFWFMTGNRVIVHS